MKNFIKTVFAVLFGNIIFFGFFVLTIVLTMIGLAINSDKDSLEIKSNSLLTLEIDGPLSDMSENQDFKFSFKEKTDGSGYSIHDIASAVEHAGKDAAIQGLYIPMNMNSELSYAQLEILRHAIMKFKESKKPVIAYGEVASQKMYYLSSVADKLYINPNGGLDLRGFGAQLMFFKNTLDKLEIQPQIFYAGKYKSATEPLRLTQMSEENKAQTMELLTDISDDVISNIAKNRNLDIPSVQNAINTMQSNIPSEALKSKLIDGEKFFDQVEDEFRAKLRLKKNAKLNYTSIAEYTDHNSSESKKGGLAVYVAEGDIVDGKSMEQSIGSETMVKDLRKMQADEDIKAVVLRVNSPGGSALASAVILREIELLRAKKPVVVSMGNLAASGGYYISSSAERVFAEPNTITGSIGVFGVIPNLKNMMENKLGLSFDEVELNEHAVLGINKSLDEQEASKVQLEIENIYNTFKSVVSKGRKLSMDSVEQIAQGRVWSGERAQKIGLVDEIGDLQAAIRYAAGLAKINASEYHFYNKRKSDLELLMEDFNTKSFMSYVKTNMLQSMLGSYTHYFTELKKYTEIQGAQMRMIYEVKI